MCASAAGLQAIENSAILEPPRCGLPSLGGLRSQPADGGGGSEWSGTRPRPHSQWRQNLHQVTPAIDCAFPSQAGRVMKWVLASSFSPLRLLLALLLSLVNEDKVADSGVRGRASICPKPF